MSIWQDKDGWLPRVRGDRPLTHTAGDLSSNGIVLHSHTHTGVQSGGSQTGAPV